MKDNTIRSIEVGVELVKWGAVLAFAIAWAGACEAAAPPTPGITTPLVVEVPDAPAEAPADPVPALSALLPELHPPKVLEWQSVEGEGYGRLAGRWVGVEFGDALRERGSIVDGGYRVDIVEGKPKSKTPFNLTFWAPTFAHVRSNTISGSCGFEPSGQAWCRGYGVNRYKSQIFFETAGGGETMQLRIRIGGFETPPFVEMLVQR